MLQCVTMSPINFVFAGFPHNEELHVTITMQALEIAEIYLNVQVMQFVVSFLQCFFKHYD